MVRVMLMLQGNETRPLQGGGRGVFQDLTLSRSQTVKVYRLQDTSKITPLSVYKEGLHFLTFVFNFCL